MDMPYSDNEGVSIRYEVEGEGPPLVLQHGLGLAIEQWHLGGYVEKLKNDYQLILIDARGHGASDKPHDPEAYRVERQVADVVTVLDDLSIGKAHYLGYSMGGWIGWGIAKYAPQSFHSLIIGGADPYEGDPEQPNVFLDLFQKGMDAFLATLEPMFGQWWTPELKAMCQANDLEALIAMCSVQERLGFEDMLPTVTVPCLLFAGEATDEHSGMQECVKSMPNATFVSLPGLDHIEAFGRTDLVLPHVRRFLAEVS
jgi:pimeloyl-ACP methyl ester carboxylesterase